MALSGAPALGGSQHQCPQGCCSHCPQEPHWRGVLETQRGGQSSVEAGAWGGDGRSGPWGKQRLGRDSRLSEGGYSWEATSLKAGWGQAWAIHGKGMPVTQG